MYSEVWTLKKLYSKFWNWLAGIFRRSNYQDVPGYSGNIRENIGFRPKMIPNRAHHLRRRQVFSVASVYPIVPAAPSSSSSSRLLYPDNTSLLLMNFLITMPLFFYLFIGLCLCIFFSLIRCLCFFNCALLSLCLISVPSPCLTPMWMADGSIHLSSKYFEYYHCHVSNMHLTLVYFFIIYYFGQFWIELIVAETENWKYCNKIIFKCVNSTVRPIFNIF